MTFAEKLTELRRQKGWSQEELGEMLGVTRQTISKWELGSTTPEMEKLAAISEIFGISTDELIRGIAPENPIPQNNAAQFAEKKPHFIKGEYKSAKTFNGIPMVHINLKGRAHGVVAIGLMSSGIISIGLLAIGVVSLGLLSLGVLAIAAFFALGVLSTGAIAAGIFALGGMALGVFAMGGFSFGWLAFGGIAVGKYAVGGLATGTIAFGGAAHGIIAVGEEVSGEITIASPISAEAFKSIVNQRLPHTPKFIVELFANLADTM